MSQTGEGEPTQQPAGFASSRPPEAVYQQSSWTPRTVPRYPQIGSHINWRAALPGAAMTGMLSGIFLMFGRVGALAIVLIPLAGFVTVQLYRRRTGIPSISTGTGAKLGGFCGLFAFLIVALAMIYVFSAQGAEVQQLLSAQMASRPMDPAQAAMMHRFIDTPSGRAIICVAGLMFFLPVILILAVAGGAAGATMSGKKHRS